MKTILIFSPYILLPLLMTHLCKRYRWSWVGLTYLIVIVALFFYPFGLFWLEDYLYPPPPGPRCLTPQTGFIFGNLFIFLPIALLVQLVVNMVFLKKGIKSD